MPQLEPQIVTIGSAPGEFDHHDRAQEKHNLHIAIAGLVVAVFPFVLEWSTGNHYLDFAVTIFAAGAFGFAKRYLQDNRHGVVVPPPNQQRPTWGPTAPANNPDHPDQVKFPGW